MFRIPQIVAEGPRWWVVHKPPRFSLDASGGIYSVESFLNFHEKPIFPLRLDQESMGLTIVCGDRGMSSQIARHIEQGRVKKWYRFICAEDDSPENLKPLQSSTSPSSPHLQTLADSMHLTPSTSSSSSTMVEVRGYSFGRKADIMNLLKQKQLKVMQSEEGMSLMHLYKLTFPNPTNSSAEDFSVEVGYPAEWTAFYYPPDELVGGTAA